jgi:hypothetical protein
MEYHLKKKKEEMQELMNRFTLTNTQHQHIMNENIRLVAQIRKRKKEEVKKIKDRQKDRFKKKVKNLKKTIMKQSKVGNTGETILRNSVLEKHFDKYSVVDDTSTVQHEEPGFFNKIKESMMIFGGNDSKPKRIKQQSPKESVKSKNSNKKITSPKEVEYNFQKKPNKKPGSLKSQKFICDDESQIIDQKNFRKMNIGNFNNFKNRSRINNMSDTSDEEAKPRESTSIENKKNKHNKLNKSKKSSKPGSKGISDDKKLTVGKTLHPSKTNIFLN